MTLARSDLEGLDGYVPPPYVPPLALDERLVKLWRDVTRTPGRTAVAVVDLCAITAFLVSLRPVGIATVDAVGPLRARCGISFYVGGASNHAVEMACRYAFASRVPDLVGSALVVIVATAALIVAITQPARVTTWSRSWRAVIATPAGAAAATVGLAALLTLVVAAQPVAVVTTDAAGQLRARCGVESVIVGSANAAVGHACRTADGPRATVFFGSLVLLCVGVGTVLKFGFRARPD